MARSRRPLRRKSRPCRFERLEQRLALAAAVTQQVIATPPVALLPRIELSHFGQDIPFTDATGGVQTIMVVNPGSGYSAATPPSVTISGGGGSGATARAIVSAAQSTSGQVVGIEVTNAGKAYTSAPTVTISGGGGSGATAEATFYATGEEKFAAWAQDYVTFVTNSGVGVCYINIGDYSPTVDTKGAYAYLDPAKGDPAKGNAGVPWIVTHFLDKLPAGVEVGAIAYLDVANPWTIYDKNNFASNNLTTDGGTKSPPKNNMYQSFQMVNAINAIQQQKNGSKFITHYQADGEGAGAFETDSYYGFGGAPAQAGALYDPSTPNQISPGNWSWANPSTPTEWPVAGYGFTKWLWNSFMPGTTSPASGGTALPAGGAMPDLVFTHTEAVAPQTWSSEQSHGYQFGIIKYAQTSWLQYSPGPMVAYTENYWFGENHYAAGAGSAILPDTTINIDGVNTPILNAPDTPTQFRYGAPQITFNTPTVDGKQTGAPIGTAAQGVAVMGIGAIDTDTVSSDLHNFFGAGQGQGYSTGAWVTSGGTGYSLGNKYNVNVIFSPPPPVPGARQATGYISAVNDQGAVLGILVTDPGAGYVTEPTITFTDPNGSGATAVALVLPEDGYPTVTFPNPPGSTFPTAKGYLQVNPQSNKPGSISQLVILDPGSGYDTASVADNPAGNPLAGPNGLQLAISSPVPGAPHQNDILAAAGARAVAPCPSIFVPVNSSPFQIDHIVLTVLGDHYDAALNPPSYTIQHDTPGKSYSLKIDPNYNAAYAPIFNKAGSFPIDGTGLSSVTVLARGSGYSAGAVITNKGGGYDNQTLYPVTFSAPTGVSPRTATGFLNVDSNGYATGVTITDAGSGYTAEPAITIPGPGANVHGGITAQATAHLLNYPRVTMSGGSFRNGTGTPAVPYVITGPADKNNPGDPDTSYVVTGIGFTNPGVGYDETANAPTFTISAPADGATAVVQALPALATKYSAYGLPTLPEINKGPAPPTFAGPIQGGANAYNWQISNGYGSGQVTGVTIVASGSGYSATHPPAVTFSAPQPGGVAAQGVAVVDVNGSVTGITIQNAGYGYLTAPTVVIAPPATGTAATATATIGDILILSAAALNTVYDYYAAFPPFLAQIFNDPLYQDVSLPKLGEAFYHPRNAADWVVPQAGNQASINAWTNVIDGTKVGQSAIATFSIESLDRSNFGAVTCLDAKYQDPVSLAGANTYGGTFAGLSSLTYPQFVDFLNSAATIIANNAGLKPDGSKMLPQDVTFQIYDAAFLPLEWLTQANPNRWSAVNEAPVFVSQGGGSVVENTSHATPIYTAHASDVGTTWAERTVTYSLRPGVGDAADLTIDPRSGEVRLLRPANYEAKRSYTFVVVASDGGSPVLTSERAVTVAVDDVPEEPTAPAIAAPARFTVLEDGATPLTFPHVPFSDADSSAHKPMTVTLGVPVGRIVAASGAGVTVGGSAKRRTLSGRLDAINAYLTAGRVSYVPEAGAVAARTLSIVISESYGSFSRRATAESALDVSPVDDAPRVQSPARFRVLEDAPGNLVWPAGITPFSDDDSAVLTVTLSVDRGVIASAGGEGVTVGGSDTARTFRGAPADLNRLFQRAGAIIYTPATDDTAAVTLTTTVDDGVSQAVASSRIMIVPLNDAPTQQASGLMLGATVGRPVRIDPAQLAAATVARDVDSRRVSFLLTGTTSGQVERLVGGRWVPMRTTGPVATRLIDGRDPVRWVAPTGALGTTPAFTVQAWDGRSASTTISQISVSIAATDDTAFAYFIDDTTQVSNVPAGYGVIGEFSETERATAVASGRIVGESVAMFNQQSNNTVGYSLWPLIENLFQSRTPVAPGDRQALARQILDQVLVNKGLTATSEFPSPDEGVPAGPGAGYVIWAQDFEFRPGIVPTTDVYAGVTAVLWAGRTYLGDSFKIMPVPSSSLFKTLGDTTVNGKGAYVSDEIINGTASTPYLASLGLEGLPENPQHGSNGEWNFLSLLYANGLIDGFFGQNYNTTQVGIVTPDTLPFHDPSLPYAIQSAHDNPTQVASGGPWSTVYNGDVPFHATVYWLANVDPTWGQPPKKPVLQPTQAPLPTTAFAAYGRSN